MHTPPGTPIPLPDWLDRTAYPFAPRPFDTADGRMSYVDVGSGSPVVLVHGTPAWSFLYRHLIAGLAATHRVIAPDHLGFGLSDKPPRAPYRPADHAVRLAALLDRLGLSDVTLVVHDFGGPIGLSYAIERPERVSRLVLLNTWAWSLRGTPAERASRLAAGPLGRFLYRTLDASPRFLMKAVMGDRSKLTPTIHRQYLAPFARAADRTAPWVLARELIGSTDWYESLWAERARLRQKPALLLWGMRDPTFGEAYLRRWQEALPDARVERFPGSGHFVQEEEGAALVPIVRDFASGDLAPPRAARVAPAPLAGG